MVGVFMCSMLYFVQLKCWPVIVCRNLACHSKIAIFAIYIRIRIERYFFDSSVFKCQIVLDRFVFERVCEASLRVLSN